MKNRVFTFPYCSNVSPGAAMSCTVHNWQLLAGEAEPSNFFCIHTSCNELLGSVDVFPVRNGSALKGSDKNSCRYVRATLDMCWLAKLDLSFVGSSSNHIKGVQQDAAGWCLLGPYLLEGGISRKHSTPQSADNLLRAHWWKVLCMWLIIQPATLHYVLHCVPWVQLCGNTRGRHVPVCAGAELVGRSASPGPSSHCRVSGRPPSFSRRFLEPISELHFHLLLFLTLC